MKKQIHTSSGFTLVELLVAITVFSIIVALIVSSRIQQQDQHITQVQALEMQQSVRAAMFLMKQELRMAGFNPLPDDYGAGITAATATSISFSAVDDEDGNLRTVAFDFAAPQITVDYNSSGAQVMADNIQNLVMTYLDEDNNPAAALADIRSVQISIAATTSASELVRDTDNATRTLTTTVYLRNMGLR